MLQLYHIGEAERLLPKRNCNQARPASQPSSAAFERMASMVLNEASLAKRIEKLSPNKVKRVARALANEPAAWQALARALAVAEAAPASPEDEWDRAQTSLLAWCGCESVAPDARAEEETETIFEDSSGFMWFGTDSGISRYDGQTFTTFTTANHPHHFHHPTIIHRRRERPLTTSSGLTLGSRSAALRPLGG